MRPNYLFVLIAWLWFGTTAARAQDSTWTLVKNSDGIKVYSHNSDQSQLKSIYVTTEAPVSVTSLVSVIKDAPHHRNWIYLCKEGRIIRHLSSDEWIYYNESDAPWPFEDRDAVTWVKLSRDDAGDVFIRSHTFHDSIPKKSNYIRIPYVRTQWEFCPEKNGLTKIGLKITVDLGGKIPKWLMRLTASKGPYHTMKNLLVQIQNKTTKSEHQPQVSDP